MSACTTHRLFRKIENFTNNVTEDEEPLKNRKYRSCWSSCSILHYSCRGTEQSVRDVCWQNIGDLPLDCLLCFLFLPSLTSRRPRTSQFLLPPSSVLASSSKGLGVPLKLFSNTIPTSFFTLNIFTSSAGQLWYRMLRFNQISGIGIVCVVLWGSVCG